MEYTLKGMCRTLLATGLVLAMYLDNSLARPKSSCNEQPLEYREELANVVISGTVKEIMADATGKKMYKSEVEVKRIFKGENIVNQLSNFEDPVNHHKMLMIDGFGDEEICESQVRKYDTRIFLLNKGSNGDLRLNSSIVRITLTNLEYTDAVVKDLPYTKPEPPKKSPCETHFCAFDAQCMVNITTGDAFCKCNTFCSNVFAPVCGTDDVTYANECLLKKMSCNLQKRIKVKVNGRCGIKNPCEDQPCKFGARCVPSLDGSSFRCVCQTKCDDYGDNLGSFPVCGNDGVDYPSSCELQLIACRSMKDLRIKYYGKCDPCRGFNCEEPQVCQLGPQRKPVCRCNYECSGGLDKVCGTDRRTYSNTCFLRQEACKSGKTIEVLHSGPCTPGINVISPATVQDEYNKYGSNPCDDKRCRPEEECTVDRQGRANCGCPPKCPEIVRKVCGNDTRTYDSECELRQQSCLAKVYVVVADTGPCVRDIPCRDHPCDHDSVCVPRDGHPTCQCAFCTDEYEPVCGEDGITYNNPCKLRQENCEKKTRNKIKHRGPCTGCENVKCDYHSVCNSDGSRAQCVCPKSCAENDNSPVCGSDGRTYRNECQLKINSCRYKTFISVASYGECDECRGTKCRFGAMCENGKCMCPLLCPSLHQPVCASNGKMYINECAMRRDACAMMEDLEIQDNEKCESIDIGSGSGDESGDYMEKCDASTCKYGGTCVEGDGMFTCECQFTCPALRKTVCGSDDKTYSNECQLKVEACQSQKEITVQNIDNCDEIASEEPCDGNQPLVNGDTGEDFDCDFGKDKCPAGSYCHISLSFAKCCKEETIPHFQISHCSQTVYGCCSDNMTVSPGPRQAGCPEYCHCNPLGSFRRTCNPISRQCRCKPGVGGLRCDRCQPGYWGLHKIDEGNTGCIPCGCNEYGSARDDCDQMVGRCICHPNISGMKCNRCRDNKILGPQGCKDQPVATSCEELDCRFGAICKLHDNRLQCVCENCNMEDEHGSHDRTVCGTDGKNYASACQLRVFACRLQQRIKVQYRGECRAPPSTRTTTPMPSTTRSRKTTRHIQGPIPPDVDEEIEGAETSGTDQPSTPEVEATTSCGDMGKIDDLCLDDSDCCVNNSRCRLGLCNCLDGYVPSIDNRHCIEVIRNPDNHHNENIDNACMHSLCENGGECELDDSLGYRCVCPLGKTGPLCKEDNSFHIPSFSGKSYLKVPRIRKANQNLNIEVVFQTLNKNGILLFNSQSQDGSGDYISLAIKDGFVEFRYDLGGGESTIRSKSQVVLKKSHRVVIKRSRESGMMIFDNEDPVSGSSVATHTSLNLRDPLYVGFVPNASPDVYERIGVNLGLVGCIHVLKAGNEDNLREYNLQYPSQNPDIADGADIGECGTNPCKTMPCKNDGTCIMLDQNNFQCFCKEGYAGLLCETLENPCASEPCQYGGTCMTMVNDIGYECLCTEARSGSRCEKESLKRVYVPQFSGDGYMELPIEDNIGKQLTIEVWFKAFAANGVILFGTQYSGGKGDFISLNLVKRKLQFRFSLGDKTAKLETKNHVHLNKWHKVLISIHNLMGQLVLDKHPAVKGKAPGKMKVLNLERPLYIGGYKEESSLPQDANIKANFEGAIQRVIINGRTIKNLIEVSDEMRNIGEYSGAPCNMNPCMNGGVCIPKLDDADCRCPLEYMGERCEKRAEHVDQDQPVKFDSNTYLQYPNEKTQKSLAQRNNVIKIRFRTHDSNGLLVLQSKGPDVTGDYLAIAVVNGKVELSYNLGKQTEGNLFRIRSNVYVADGQWHELEALRTLADGSLQVDDEPAVTASSDVGASQLDTDGDLWIGGNPSLPFGLPPEYFSGFSGCIDQVVINRVELHLVEDRESHSSTIAFCS